MSAIERGEPDPLNLVRLPTGTLVEDLGCPHCGKTCDVCVILDEERHQLRDAYREAVEALRAVERMLAESGVEGPTRRVVATGNVTCALDRVREALKGQSGPGKATG
jgi:hypothetical protein